MNNLIKKTGDSYSEYVYKRLSSLRISPPVTNMRDLQPGDCLIAFSRKKCHALKNHIEKSQPGSCAIIYGNLPPEVRKDQAQKFNTQQYKYLIATDAIGMGLNYSINRIIFLELEKRDRKCKRKLFPHEIKQIAGRAGRFENDGLVTGCDIRDLNEISIGLSYNANNSINKAGLCPNYEQIKEFADNYAIESDKIQYSKLLTKFSKQAKLENIYFFQSIEEVCNIAKCIENIGLNLEDMHKFCNTSFRGYSNEFMKILKGYAKDYLDKREIKFQNFIDVFSCELDELEKAYILSDSYLALARKFDEGVFKDADEVKRFAQNLSMAIMDKLSTQINPEFEMKLTNYS